MNKNLSVLLLAFLISTSCTRWDYSDPNMPEGVREYHEGLLEDALSALEEEPMEQKKLLNVAYEYQVLGDYKNAVKFYNKILEQDENDYVSLNNLADIYETMENYDLAAEMIRRLYVLDPGSVEAIKDTVRILLKADAPSNAQEALDYFKKNVNEEEPEMATLVQDLQDKINAYPPIK